MKLSKKKENNPLQLRRRPRSTNNPVRFIKIKAAVFVKTNDHPNASDQKGRGDFRRSSDTNQEPVPMRKKSD
jgi:hypothetical protein